MNNLHRELAPISDAAWAQIEEEATRTLKRHLARRRVVDVHGPAGFELSAVGTGHVRRVDPIAEAASPPGCASSSPLVELRVPVRAGPPGHRRRRARREDSDWQPVKDAAQADRLRRGPRDLRRLPARRRSRASARAPATRSRAAGRRAPIPGRAVAEAISQLRLVGRQRAVPSRTQRRRVHRRQRDQRPRLSGAGAHPPAGRATRSSGRRRSPAPSC